MIPGLNPRQMRQAMKKLGMQQEDIEAVEVIIRTPDKEIYFEQPNVAKINMMGQETFQVVGEYVERAISKDIEINEDDINTVVEQTGVSHEKARQAIKEANGDLAEAIMKLSNIDSDMDNETSNEDYDSDEEE